MTVRTLNYRIYADRDAALRVYFPYRMDLTKKSAAYREEADWVLERFGSSAFLTFHRVNTDRRWLVDDGKIYFKDENDAFEYRMRWAGV